MARPSSGTLHTHTLADGTRAFHLRVRYGEERPRIVLHEQSGCVCGCGGGWNEPAARTELGNILARIRVGVWEPPRPPAPLAELADGGRDRVETFREYAEWWIQAKLSGEIGRRPIGPATERDNRWRLSHLLAFFGDYPLDQIDRELCQAFKAHKLAEARELRDALAAGAEIRDRLGNPKRPLGLDSLRRIIATLATILDEAIEDEKIDRNPARSRRMRISVPPPRRSFLEMDELAMLIEAASDQDQTLHAVPDHLGPTATNVARLLTEGLRPLQIARELGLSDATVSYHARRLGARVGHGYIGRGVICEIAGRCGVRVSELCDIRIGHLRLHDPNGARFRIPDSKTPTGIREVQMTPDLVNAVTRHIERLRRAGRPTSPNDYLVQNIRGGRLTRQRVGQIITQAAELANQRLTERGLPAITHATPHTLRRTYISIALVANNFDVRWVMSQVGHADSKMTLDVYAQLEQRADRTHGTNFDRLVHQARERLVMYMTPSEQVSVAPVAWALEQ